MVPREFLAAAAVALAMLVLATLIEWAVPLFTRTPAQRGRRATNLCLAALTISWNGALTWAAASMALALALQGPGLMTRLGVPILAQIIGGFVVLDFCFGYLAHRMLHSSPVLWRVHQVHHSDVFVDATTTFRNHPLEGAWRFAFLIVPIWLLGIPAEAVALQKLLSVINGNLEHANIRVWRPVERVLSLVWVTPNMHKVHHSRERRETDTNYGNILSIYDRILRTFTPADRVFTVSYGLDDVDPAEAKSLPRLLGMPFRAADATGETAAAASRPS